MLSKTQIVYKGDVLSLNQYKSLNWQKLRSKTKPLQTKFNILISKAAPPPLKWMELRVEHNTRLDLDNITGTIKIFVDCLRAKGVLHDDRKQFWDYLSIKYNPELEKKTLVFNILGELKN